MGVFASKGSCTDGCCFQGFKFTSVKTDADAFGLENIEFLTSPKSRMPLPSKRELLSVRLQEVEQLLEKSSDVDVGTSAEARSDVSIVIGSSKHLAEHPDFAERLSKTITDAYVAVGGHPLMIEQQPVTNRLQFGDGSDARGDGILNTNRVLHIAFVDGAPVGCISSSKTTAWSAGTGHWGLLVVDLNMQGKGIGAALIEAAEARIVQHASGIQMEYEFEEANPHSKKLEAMYTKRGYKVMMTIPHPTIKDSSAEFRILTKRFTEEEQQRGVRRKLLAERAEIMSLLSQSPADPTTREPAPLYQMQSQGLFDALAANVKATGTENMEGGPGGAKKVYQLFVADVIPRYGFVVDLKNGAGSTREGEDPDAEITISMTDANWVAWWKQTLDWKDAFWRGQIETKSTLPLEGGPGMWWSDSVDKLAKLFSNSE